MDLCTVILHHSGNREAGYLFCRTQFWTNHAVNEMVANERETLYTITMMVMMRMVPENSSPLLGNT